MGDLNEIATQSERIGGNPYNPADNKYFSDFILNTGMIDLGFDGVPFTWCNNQFGNNGIHLQRQRLDRALASCDWRTLFPNARVVNLPITKFSDHSPMLIQPRCKNIVKNAWRKNPPGSNPYVFCRKLKVAKIELQSWNKDKFGNIHERVRILREDLAKCQKANPINLPREASIQENLDNALGLQEKLWRDKSRDLRLKCDGTNSRFFHISTVIRRNRAHIMKLKDGNGNWIENDSDMGNEICNHFESIFKSSNPEINVAYWTLYPHVSLKKRIKLLLKKSLSWKLKKPFSV
ncbi:hypothetical protein ACHQM5_020501 [Ranunculus cassubicifolius]